MYKSVRKTLLLPNYKGLPPFCIRATCTNTEMPETAISTVNQLQKVKKFWGSFLCIRSLGN